MPEFTTYDHGVPSWVDVTLSDPEAGQRFYAEVFGWEVEAGPPEAGGYAMFTKGGKPVAGVGPKMSPDQSSVWATYVNVDDAAVIAQRVGAAGGQVLFGPMAVLDSGTMLVFAAPDGSVCGAWQPGAHKGAQLANEPGAWCWNELVTTDAEGAGAFYTQVFGWVPEHQDMGGSDYTIFQVNGAPACGMVSHGELPEGVPSHWVAYFAVESCDEVTQRATALGASVVVGPLDSPIGRFAVLADPEGAVFATIQFPEAAEASA